MANWTSSSHSNKWSWDFQQVSPPDGYWGVSRMFQMWHRRTRWCYLAHHVRVYGIYWYLRRNPIIHPRYRQGARYPNKAGLDDAGESQRIGPGTFLCRCGTNQVDGSRPRAANTTKHRQQCPMWDIAILLYLSIITSNRKLKMTQGYPCKIVVLGSS